MPFTVTMPKLSPTMEKGTVVKWYKKEGDHVKGGDLLFEVATDKATVEHEALDEGYLRKILVLENQEAHINQPVAVFTVLQEESIEGYDSEQQPKNIEEKALPREPLEKIEKETEPSFATSKENVLSCPHFPIEAPLSNYEFPFETSFSHLKASPLAKKLAKEKGLDLEEVKGSGPHGRIMSRDLHLAQPKKTFAFERGKIPTKPPGSFTKVSMSPMRKAIAKKLQASKTFIPHFYVQLDIDAMPIIETRMALKSGGLKITLNDFILRAVALSLKKHPIVNSGFDSQDQTIVRFETIDVAVAVSLEEGLMTPILRHIDYKNISQISSEVKSLAERAKKGKLKPSEYQGGSFTVSNLGMFGIYDFQAVINPPQTAILAVGGIRECPVVKEGKICVGKQMMLSLSSDHRVIDGFHAADFLKSVEDFLLHPALLLV